MLSVLRQNANNWFMILLFAIITVVFIFTFGSWGGGDVSGQMPIAATVNDRVISQAQFQALYSSMFNNMRQFRQGYDLEDAEREDLKRTVLDQLIGTELLAQEAEERGLYISDEEVVDEIKRVYFRDREFDLEDYKRIVNGVYQTNEARFEDQIRRQLLGRRLEEVLGEMQQVSPLEVKEAFNDQYNRVSLKVLRLDPAFFKDQYTEATDDEAKAWADQNPDKITKFYNEHTNRYRKPAQVKARHILAKYEAGDEEAKKAAREKLEAAQERLEAGEDFATVAKAVSEDGTAVNGGDLGWFAKGTMLGGQFEDAAFSLEKGKVSNIVESSQGLHLLKVEDKKPASVQEMAEVRTEIAKQLMREAFTETAAQKRAEAALAAVKGGTPMEELSIEGYEGSLTDPGDDRMAPRVEETGWFNQDARYVPRVGISDEVVEAAFGLTEEQPVADEVFEVAGRLYVIKLKERERPDPEKFAAERGTIETSLLQPRKQRVLDSFLEELKETADISRNEKVLSYGS